MIKVTATHELFCSNMPKSLPQSQPRNLFPPNHKKKAKTNAIYAKPKEEEEEEQTSKMQCYRHRLKILGLQKI